MSKPGAPAALRERGAVHVREALRREEDRQPAVGDLGGERDVLRPDRGEVDRHLAAQRVDDDLQRLAEAGRVLAGVGDVVVLAVVLERLLAAQDRAHDLDVLAGAARAACPRPAPCQPSATCGPDAPRPSSTRPPERVSSVAAVIAVVGGRARRHLHDRRADLDPLGRRGDPRQRRHGVGARRPPTSRRNGSRGGPPPARARPRRPGRRSSVAGQGAQCASIPPLSAFAPTPEVAELRGRVRAFMDEHVYPNEGRLFAEDASSDALIADLQGKAKAAGLWAPHIGPEAGGSGTGFLAYAYLNEEIGRTRLGAAHPRLPGARRRQRRDPAHVRHRRAEGALAASRSSRARSAPSSR